MKVSTEAISSSAFSKGWADALVLAVKPSIDLADLLGLQLLILVHLMAKAEAEKELKEDNLLRHKKRWGVFITNFEDEDEAAVIEAATETETAALVAIFSFCF